MREKSIEELEEELKKAKRKEKRDDLIICPLAKEIVSKEFCQTFFKGKGCKFLEVCPALDFRKEVKNDRPENLDESQIKNVEKSL